MLGAMFLVHLPNGFFLPSGIEFVLALFAGAGAIAIAGPGALSLDGVLFGGKRLSLEARSVRRTAGGASKAA
jgi:putative oxidoreductase